MQTTTRLTTAPAWIVCRNFDQFPVADTPLLQRLAERGHVRADDYVFSPRRDTCIQARELPELAASFSKARAERTVWLRALGGRALLLVMLGSGCSLRRMAVNQIGNTIAAGGSTFAADDDPELIGGALPFSLKLIESLIAETPNHTALLVSAARGYTQYANGWVEPIGDESDPLRSRARAGRLYLRARDYGVRALNSSIPGFEKRLATDPRAAVALASKRDVPALYWTAAAWGLAIAGAKDEPELLADLPVVDALISRAAELDPGFDGGAIDTFLIAYEMAGSAVSKDATGKAREHFKSAIARSGGLSAGPYVTAAETLAVAADDRAEFESLLRAALAIDVAKKPEWRLANIISQRRARWLLDHADDFFLSPSTEEKTK